MKTMKARKLHELIRATLIAAGADETNAELVAEHLVSANLVGVDTHGAWHLPGYVDAIRTGDIVPTATASTLQESPTSALISGNWGFGHPACRFATEVAIEKAAAQNIAVVSLVQAHHIGRLGYYVELAAAKNLIALVWAGGYGAEEPAAVPFGGAKAVLHTNPIAIGFPCGDERPVVIDFATTAGAGVKVVEAKRKGEQLPADWIVDKEGCETTDPNAFFDGGAHRPFGGHKGYAMMVAAELLGRVVSGADAFVDDRYAGPIMRHQGVTILTIKADLFQPAADYARQLSQLRQSIRSVPPAPGFDEVLVPGDLEASARAARQRDGIPIPDHTWQAICEAAQSLGVDV